MSKILTELKQTVLSIYNNNNEVVSNCFVITFNADQEKKTIRPFLVFDKNENITNDCYIALPVVDNEGHHRILKKELSLGLLRQEFLIADFNVITIPFAFVYNDLFKEKCTINFKTIQEELFFNDDVRAKISPYETLSFFSFEKTINDCAYYNSHPISSIKETKPFFIDCPRPKTMGFPVFVFNDATYVENNSVNLGSRLILAGVATSSFDGLIKIEPIDLIVKEMKNKFNFLS